MWLKFEIIWTRIGLVIWLQNYINFSLYISIAMSRPIDWGCWIRRLYLCRGVIHHPLNEYSRYDTKTIWCCGSSSGAFGNVDYPSLLLLPGPLWLGTVVLDRIRRHLEFSKKDQPVPKNLTKSTFLLKSDQIYSNTWKTYTVNPKTLIEDKTNKILLSLNDLQRLICH